jgi:hypothetical protein
MIVGFRRNVMMLVVGSVLPWASAPMARAELWKDIGVGLGFAGFNIQGQNNILSGGTDFRIGQNFLGNPLTFGLGELVLNGPISVELSTGNRWLDTVQVHIQTATDSRGAPQALNYDLLLDAGPQSTQVSGSLLMDIDFSLNGFGFYDLNVNYSSRQTTTNEDRFRDETDTSDFDIGPVNVQGNLFADLLGLLVEPIFGASGAANPFESFSGRLQLQKLIDERTAAQTGLMADTQPLPDFVGPSVSSFDTSGPELNGDLAPAPNGPRVPEPGTLLLLGVAGVALLRRRRTP